MLSSHNRFSLIVVLRPDLQNVYYVYDGELLYYLQVVLDQDHLPSVVNVSVT